MHSPMAMEHFRMYGFVVLRGFFDTPTVEALRAEVREALGDSYDLPTEAVPEATGRVGYYLPMMGDRTPVSRALAVDERLTSLAELFLSRPPVPKPAKGILYRDASPWHQDSTDPDLAAVKVVAYLDPLTPRTGALQVLPGSHRAPWADDLRSYRARWPASEPFDEDRELRLWPGLTLTTEPGDVIAFDVHLWHASLHGRDRWQWSVSYAGHPGAGADLTKLRAHIGSFSTEGHTYDAAAYPYFDRSWLREHRRPTLALLEEIGVI
jgi:hypothetical protein